MDKIVPDPLAEIGRQVGILFALQCSLIRMARGADGLKELRLTLQALSQRSDVIPLDVLVEDTRTQSTTIVLFLQNCFLLVLVQVKPFSFQKRQKRLHSYRR